MITKPSRLRAVPRLAGKIGFDYRFAVASQVLAAGTQDVFVQPIVPLSGPGKGQIGVRVGRLLVYVANREALQSFLDAWAQAEALADKAFGPDMPPPLIGDGQAAHHG
jgi:hypothetical protein